jgi:hypothetical protein
MKRALFITALLNTSMFSAPALIAQGARLASPPGIAATEIRGKYRSAGDEPVYEGGKWIEITYGRPIKRGRDLWGSGADYGKMLNSGAPVWRAGANATTRLKTELPLVIGGKTIAPGEYSLFIDLKPGNWTFIVSSWAAQSTYDPSNTAALWGSFGYTPAKDVARAPMTLGTLPVAVDQLTWQFSDMSDGGGTLTIMWDKMIASVPFTIGR